MATLVYDSQKEMIVYGDSGYRHNSGGEKMDDIAAVLVHFDAGEISLQDAWLKLKYLQDNKGD